MDLTTTTPTPTPTPITIPPQTTSKSPDSDTDTETPQLQSHLCKPSSLSINGSLNPHQTLVLSYKECLKNHAASLGGLALDGCGEFMPISNATPHDPSSLKCAACGCHRNFHRRETKSTDNSNFLLTWNSSNPSSPASPTPQQSVFPSAPHMLLALGSAQNPSLNASTVMNPHGKKRARTKFSEEQKEKMYAFAEKLGWKMVRAGGDKVVEEFCSEIGVKRKVFKVWMHNNKSRREKGSNGNGDGGDAVTYSFNNVNTTANEFDRFRLESKVSVQGFTDDGSSSPSS